ncbi:hypothetical protein ACH5RR_005677 [Cinchona calisaya]|uniref:Uncharacterized protein n=1 Tax=Cinchona calisaya TaxID=153742 RepID=A0ABD3ALU3_9GENT
MSGISKLGAALTVIFVVSLVALFAELLYVLWRRRVFHRQTPTQATVHGGAVADTTWQTFSESSSTFTSSSSKELLYFFFFCRDRGQITRVEPHSTPPPSVNSAGSCPEEEEMEVIDVFKLQDMYGPSRVLFTIKEEDRENDTDSSAEKKSNSKRVNNLEEFFKAADDESTSQVAVAVALVVGDDHSSGSLGGESAITPFSTPCESPVYFTPAASPSRELIDSV